MLLRVIVIVLALLTPTSAAAQDRVAARLADTGTDSILKSAERLLAAKAAAQAAGTQQTGKRLSPARLGIGLAAVAAGVAMMLIDPEQPTQPDVVSRDAFIDASVQGVIGLSQLDVIAIRRGAGVGVLVCEPFCLGDIDEALLGAFAVGAGFGIGTAAGTIDDRGWRLHEGAIQPFKERAPALKYGGAALAAAGAIVTALWSHVPVANSVAVSPAVGGFRISASIGF